MGGRPPVERRWTLIAEDGDGPWTPCLAAPLLAKRLEAGELAAGAYPAVGLLPLAAFEGAWADLAFYTERTALQREPPLYARVMGEALAQLPPAVAAIHRVAGAAVATGRASVERGANPLAPLVAGLLHFPPATPDTPVTVWFSEEGGVETWTRCFGGSTFQSQLRQRGPLLVERFGPLRFGFALPCDGTGLRMILRRWWVGLIPLPLALAPKIAASEQEREGRFHLDVAIALPLLGPVVRYRGWLERR